MTVPGPFAALAADFWARAGEREPFPRKLVRPIANAVPLAVIPLHRPTVDSVLERFRATGIDCRLETPDRNLRACLIARNGHGFAVIDSSDTEDEQRFSLAHELAHFLQDYLAPRARVRRTIGPAALEVLDGRRPPTADERVHAVLGQIALGFHVHLMERGPGRVLLSAAVAEAEARADRLAYELLAPAERVWAATRERDPSSVESLLREQFGLPERHANQYARLLVPPTRSDPLLNWLRAAPV